MLLNTRIWASYLILADREWEDLLNKDLLSPYDVENLMPNLYSRKDIRN